ncbi:hypothetical protein JP75_02705 [Devosia riboflavina]|uniref:DUF4345 domain-containing protein n=1 Tax=Devosia riboflavina TaxID=46914 RepID=A0A087M6H8_9HYPH|nr:DUF4345 domain-containing protein [Devosia riboflavina]KFL32481.1 hypothetical protein JP75_02705 [Devosia riboflavina]
MIRLTQAYLALAALTALFVGLGMLSMPVAFYGSYGIDPTLSPSLASELRSPGVLLTSIGLFFAYGIISPRWRNFALWTAAVFYLGYATARALSLALDGIPSTGLLVAGAFELALGLAAAALLLTQRRTITA